MSLNFLSTSCKLLLESNDDSEMVELDSFSAASTRVKA